jgi:hypothetical protein
MPKLADKHSNAELVTFSDFSGGLNLARPPENIGNDELQEAVNFEFAADTGALRVRGGLALVYEFDEPVTDIINTGDGNVVLVRAGDVYRLNIAAQSVTDLGAVEGDKPASSELWDEESVVMCFGGPLYTYTPGAGSDLTRIDTEGSPDSAEILSVRGGRVCVASMGSDTLRVSAVGDATNWIEDSGDDSSAQHVDIGYKDGRDIRAIAATLGTILVFKCPEGQPERGRIYRLQGDFPDWAVTPYSEGESAWNAGSVANVGNDIMFLTREGMANISSVTEYGDFKLGWAGAKVNPRMSVRLSALCCLRNVPEKSQLWVLDGLSGDVWVYHYSIGGGAWTLFRFAGTVTAVGSSGGVPLAALGTKLYRMDEALESDDGEKIDGWLKPRTIMRRNQVLLKQIMARFDSNATSEVHLRVENMEFIIKYDDTGHEAFTDDFDAYLDDEPLVPEPMQAAIRRRCNIRRWAITPEIVVINGAFQMTLLELEIAEV